MRHPMTPTLPHFESEGTEMTSRPTSATNLARVTAVAAVAGGLLLLGTVLQAPQRGTDYDANLEKAVSREPPPSRPRADLPEYVSDPEGGKRRAEELTVKCKGDF